MYIYILVLTHPKKSSAFAVSYSLSPLVASEAFFQICIYAKAKHVGLLSECKL